MQLVLCGNAMAMACALWTWSPQSFVVFCGKSWLGRSDTDSPLWCSVERACRVTLTVLCGVLWKSKESAGEYTDSDSILIRQVIWSQMKVWQNIRIKFVYLEWFVAAVFHS